MINVKVFFSKKGENMDTKGLTILLYSAFFSSLVDRSVEVIEGIFIVFLKNLSPDTSGCHVIGGSYRWVLSARKTNNAFAGDVPLYIFLLFVFNSLSCWNLSCTFEVFRLLCVCWLDCQDMWHAMMTKSTYPNFVAH